jgi:hypothetical protein
MEFFQVNDRIKYILRIMKEQKKRMHPSDCLELMSYMDSYEDCLILIEEFKNMGYRPGKAVYHRLTNFIFDKTQIAKHIEYLSETNFLGEYVFKQAIMISDSKEEAEIYYKESLKWNFNLGPWKDNWGLKNKAKSELEKHNEFLKDKNSEISKIMRLSENEFLSLLQSLDLNELMKFSNKPTNQNRQTFREVKQYHRDPFLATFSKKIAKGICQLCKNRAPFNDLKGFPFLESHHIHWLSKGGEDCIENVIALCPNCHRKMHVLDLKEDVDKLTKIAINQSRFNN